MGYHEGLKRVNLFIEDMLVLHGLSKNLSQLIFEMLPYFNHQDHLIVNAFMKRELAEKINSSKSSVDNAISKLNDAGLLIRIDRGVYTFHPALFEMKRILEGNTAEINILYKDNNRDIFPIKD